ncbi:LysR family transcriptional regulator [Vibrio ruber]|uniref:LysR family transcriptional regulator n=1 Tax=Vibrio ruber TaxID=184755 RepID=UPI00289374CE|nr:LysR family transcriptional regulator [Vibrio ruber]WNJ97268.1 LysR family transcriptional regulator [Vibrio ruber]
MKNIPDLQHIEIFILIVRHGSFRKAAKELNLSPPSLTSAINNLEDKLGVRLLNRSTRSLSLTEVGEEFLNNVIPVFNDYRRIIDNLNHHKKKPEGIVRINLPRIVLDLFFQEYFLKFKHEFPDIVLELFTTDRMINIIDSGFDAGIRYRSDVPKDMIAIPIGEKPALIPVASPAFIDEFGVPSSPMDLINFRCINRCFPSGQIYRWEFIDLHGKLVEVSVDGDLVLDSDISMIQAAESSLGIAFVYENLVLNNISEGSLIRLLPNYKYPVDNFCIYYPSRKYIPVPLRTLITWISSQNSIS